MGGRSDQSPGPTPQWWDSGLPARYRHRVIRPVRFIRVAMAGRDPLTGWDAQGDLCYYGTLTMTRSGPRFDDDAPIEAWRLQRGDWLLRHPLGFDRESRQVAWPLGFYSWGDCPLYNASRHPLTAGRCRFPPGP